MASGTTLLPYFERYLQKAAAAISSSCCPMAITQRWNKVNQALGINT
ncbi:hypothetical protein [Labrenzia sp. DG1229]|nr:hypothetical protein [Labrenzia sp. DG1229]